MPRSMTGRNAATRAPLLVEAVGPAGVRRLLDSLPGARTEAMHARGVAEILGERADHGIDDRGVRRRGRVVVEVKPHGNLEIWECGNLEI